MNQFILRRSYCAYKEHCRRFYRLAIFSFISLGITPGAFAQMQTGNVRGELLYTTHCIACHTTHVHWRDQRLATDWPSLKAQVRRWQSNIQLDWDEDDVLAVSSYLNSLYYRFDVSERTSKASVAPIK